jgi:6-phosphofructokinase 1
MAVPFVEMFDSKGNVKIRKVDVDSELYRVAREYMIRLEEDDFEGERIEKLANTANMSPQKFRERFGYLFGLC